MEKAFVVIVIRSVLIAFTKVLRIAQNATII